MSDDLINILSNSNKDIDNQKLMDYLSGKLSAEEKHEMEKLLVDNEFMDDAVEGLEKFENKKRLMALVEQLNVDLHKQLDKKKARKEKRKLKDQSWVYVAIILILLLVIIGFIVIKKFLDT